MGVPCPQNKMKWNRVSIGSVDRDLQVSEVILKRQFEKEVGKRVSGPSTKGLKQHACCCCWWRPIIWLLLLNPISFYRFCVSFQATTQQQLQLFPVLKREAFKTKTNTWWYMEEGTKGIQFWMVILMEYYTCAVHLCTSRDVFIMMHIYHQWSELPTQVLSPTPSFD